MKHIAILGSTGSIGENTLKVVAQYPKLYKVDVLTASHNYKLLAQQVRQFKPSAVAMDSSVIDGFLRLGIKGVKVYTLKDIEELVVKPKIDCVVLAMRGASALKPFLAAVRSGKRVAPANKEALVIAGGIIMREARKHKATIIPVDSEQSAIFQCLDGQQAPVAKVHLTASGGALRNTPRHHFNRVTVDDILRHPRWKMGAKITVDSATLMNKGFEVIEAKRLFGLENDQINVLVHPEAIIHSMVEFVDGSLLAQLAVTDMRLPIQYALTYPKRYPSHLPALDLVKLRSLTFDKPDVRKFPALELAYEAMRRDGTVPTILNAANEVAVDAFLAGKLSFTGIYKIVEKITTQHKIVHHPNLTDILQADEYARVQAREMIG